MDIKIYYMIIRFSVSKNKVFKISLGVNQKKIRVNLPAAGWSV